MKILCKSELCFQAKSLIMRITLVAYLLLLCNLVAAQRINLPAAIIAGNVDVVDQILFSGDNYSTFLYLTDMIKIAIQNHQWDILDSIYKYKKLQEELFDSCANGNLAKLEDLILNHSASPRDGGNMCILVAIKKGHINIVERLLNDEMIPITGNNLYILQALIAKNQLDMMKILLPRLRPQIVSDYALNEACRFGRLEIVELLLQDPRVDPSASSNRAIRIASQNGFSKIVERLLEEPSVLKSNLHSSLRNSREYNHSKKATIIKAAIKQQRCFVSAIGENQVKYVRNCNINNFLLICFIQMYMSEF